MDKIRQKIRKFKTEIAIASVTTLLLAEVYFRRFVYAYSAKHPDLLNVINPSRFISIFFKSDLEKQAFSIFQPLFSNIINLYFRGFLENPFPQILFFLVAPVIILLILGEDLKEYGFTFGDYKTGLLYTGIILLIMAPALYWMSGLKTVVKFYTNANQGGIWWVVFRYLLYMISWEFLFRGYFYYSLEERTGSLAMWIQSVPFAIMHMGKPAIEALTCYFGGVFLGYLSMKTRSFYYAVLIHWGIYVMLSFFIYMRGGN
ncbi:MAG: CPBP family intramembrane metalloprotease [Candidatus Eremiobacteraeota bacterium]|nr:CPBP family intramembrane metalloprotease [Candidatus Eremiobacteraeota bacterium]